MIELKDLYEGFRDAKSIIALSKQIKSLCLDLAPNLPKNLSANKSTSFINTNLNRHRAIRIMEVCGGHTHSIMKYGINQLLDGFVEFIHGPGCPVCVMPKNRIDQAIYLAMQPNVILATLGDMIKVPGSSTSLANARSKGADVRFVYSPLDLLKLAANNPDKKIVYFAIGFETTTPMSAALLERVIALGIKNLFFHINHVLVPPPMEAILSSNEVLIDAFIAPSHVSVITGYKIYERFSSVYKIPTVVAGFEPVDILEGIKMLITQIKAKKPKLENQYTRSVSYEGNLRAQELINRYFIKRTSFNWRGLGEIPYSALRLKDEFSAYDAERVFDLPQISAKEPSGCICPKIISGKAKPNECKLFGKECRPEHAIGSCMVSSEGACSAYYKYGGFYGN